MSASEATCRFSVRYPAAGGKWRFQRAHESSWDTGGAVVTDHPAAIGDLVLLTDPALDGGPVFRVVDRMIAYPQYGSWNWPAGRPQPERGPLIEVIAEPAAGLYINEAPGQVPS